MEAQEHQSKEVALRENLKVALADLEKKLELRAERFAVVLRDSGISEQKFRYIALTQLQTKPELLLGAAENPGSFITATMQMAEEGLDPSKPNEAHYVVLPDPKNGRKQVVRFRGYKGLAKLARRNSRYTDVNAEVVRKNDTYKRALGADAKLLHVLPEPGVERGPIIAAYAIAFQREAPPLWVEMTVDEIEAHAAKYIKAKTGPFTEVKTQGRKAGNFEPYALKTVLMRLCVRKLDLGADVAAAISEEFEAEPIDAPDAPASDSISTLDINAALKANVTKQQNGTAASTVADDVPLQFVDTAEEDAEVVTPAPAGAGISVNPKFDELGGFAIESKSSPFFGMSLAQVYASAGVDGLTLISTSAQHRDGERQMAKRALATLDE